ncbi:MAG: hypothetical protein ACRBG0_27760 [Lewinella sp.]|uniref:hypothetical protein n=1 Tax=Lewinella sp. TaxID=2004506 RepID=UPI003D6B4FEA
MIKFKVDASDVIKNLKKVADLDATKALELGGVEAVGLISDRSDKGKGLTGTFDEYTEKYKNKRIKSRRGTTPDLQFTGELLRSLLNSWKIKKSKTKQTITMVVPNKTHTKSKSNLRDIASGISKKRPFYGLLEKEKTQVIKVIVQALSKTYDRLQFK